MFLCVFFKKNQGDYNKYEHLRKKSKIAASDEFVRVCVCVAAGTRVGEVSVHLWEETATEEEEEETRLLLRRNPDMMKSFGHPPKTF